MHWPEGWAEANLPNMQRLKAHGLDFSRHFTASTMCSPSRAALFTGLFPTEAGVPQTLDNAGQATGAAVQPPLPATTQNLARVLQTAGYEVFYKGKMHLTYPVHYDTEQGIHWWTEADNEQMEARWGFKGWTQPDVAQTNLQGLGGGNTDNDGRTVHGGGLVQAQGSIDLVAAPQPASQLQSVRHFLRSHRGDTPFCLVVSLVNPHDIYAFPGTGLVGQGDEVPLWEKAGFRKEDFMDLPIELPETWEEDLATKPLVQASVRSLLATGLGPLLTEEDRLLYVRFYAYLHTVVDGLIGEVLDELDAAGLTEDTVIVRTSDHGELGLAHGGLRQKMGNAYEELIAVPLVISNPGLFPEPVRTEALSSAVDILPTLAELAGVGCDSRWTFRGHSLVPLLNDPQCTVQDAVHFTYDDLLENYPLKRPGMIRCIRETRWKYAVYFDPFNGYACQYELYDLEGDPLEIRNLILGRYATPETRLQRQRLHQALLQQMNEKQTWPERVAFPEVSGVEPLASQQPTMVEPEVVENWQGSMSAMG